jgi:hypothetical protein
VAALMAIAGVIIIVVCTAIYGSVVGIEEPK